MVCSRWGVNRDRFHWERLNGHNWRYTNNAWLRRGTSHCYIWRGINGDWLRRRRRRAGSKTILINGRGGGRFCGVEACKRQRSVRKMATVEA